MATERYEVVINGITTVLNLSPEDAEAQGLVKPEPEEKARTAPNKSRSPKTK